MYEYEVVKQFTFDSAHYLPGYDGKCKNMHGHTWRVEVGIKGKKLKNGILFDFSQLKILLEEICLKFDHQVLNDLEDFQGLEPTAENIGTVIFEQLQQRFTADIELGFVRIFETSNNWVTVRKDI
jgi:6-pyruvoyltetrahydropterin/6-carboxytetrahydropterin synthase